MKVLEIIEDKKTDWEQRLKSTITELKSLLGQDIKLMGGYCFHLALALFLKYDGIIIIADGGHAVAYHQEDDFSFDGRGVHKSESALYEPPSRNWKSAAGFMTAVSKGWASDKQINDLKLVQQHFIKKS